MFRTHDELTSSRLLPRHRTTGPRAVFWCRVGLVAIPPNQTVQPMSLAHCISTLVVVRAFRWLSCRLGKFYRSWLTFLLCRITLHSKFVVCIASKPIPAKGGGFVFLDRAADSWLPLVTARIPHFHNPHIGITSVPEPTRVTGFRLVVFDLDVFIKFARGSSRDVRPSGDAFAYLKRGQSLFRGWFRRPRRDIAVRFLAAYFLVLFFQCAFFSRHAAGCAGVLTVS